MCKLWFAKTKFAVRDNNTWNIERCISFRRVFQMKIAFFHGRGSGGENAKTKVKGRKILQRRRYRKRKVMHRKKNYAQAMGEKKSPVNRNSPVPYPPHHFLNGPSLRSWVIWAVIYDCHYTVICLIENASETETKQYLSAALEWKN